MLTINKYIDHTILKPTATESDVKILCDEAIKFKFYSVCINGCYVRQAKKFLEGSEVKVCSVIGFPLGAMDGDSKVYEATKCIENGADEIDMVINVGYLKSKNYEEVEKEIFNIKKAIGSKVLKVIIENCYLTNDEKIKACEICIRANADFVKTSTGFGDCGAVLEDIKIMKLVVKNNLKIKASGGIKDLKTAEEFIKYGAERLGTSSGVKFMTNGIVDNGKY